MQLYVYVFVLQAILPIKIRQNSLEKISTGVTLKLTPFMGPGQEITTNVYIEVSDVTGSGVDDLPVTGIRTVRTRVSTVNGETFGLGGLKLENKHKSARRVPILGEIPFLGWLFGYTNAVSDQLEAVVLITPYVLINPILFEELQSQFIVTFWNPDEI